MDLKKISDHIVFLSSSSIIYRDLKGDNIGFDVRGKSLHVPVYIDRHAHFLLPNR